MRTLSAMLAAIVFGLIGFAPAYASSLRVAPISLQRTAPAATATLRVTNTATRPANVQLRVMRWSQKDGQDRLEPTRDVVVSPPFTTLDPGAQQTVRVVRIAKRTVVGEENYRILVDELPRAGARKNGTVSFLLRYSIPLFFGVPDAGLPRVDWRIRYEDGKYLLSAANWGAMHTKISGVSLRDASGVERRLSDGLVGYVLAGSSMNWRMKPDVGDSPRSGPATLRIHSDTAIIDVPVDLRDGG